jgi:hypothetical protein
MTQKFLGKSKTELITDVQRQLDEIAEKMYREGKDVLPLAYNKAAWEALSHCPLPLIGPPLRVPRLRVGPDWHAAGYDFERHPRTRRLRGIE